MNELLAAIAVLGAIILGSMLVARLLFGRIEHNDFDREWWDLNH